MTTVIQQTKIILHDMARLLRGRADEIGCSAGGIIMLKAAAVLVGVVLVRVAGDSTIVASGGADVAWAIAVVVVYVRM